MKAADAANALCSTSAWRSGTACASATAITSMSEPKGLSERIDALEMRVAYQDDTIEALNQTITAQWQQIDALTRQLAELRERLQDAERNAPGAVNERPPHY